MTKGDGEYEGGGCNCLRKFTQIIIFKIDAFPEAHASFGEIWL